MTALPEAAILQHGASCIMTRSTGHSAARVRTRPAQVQALERHAVIRRANHRPGAEQLVEAHLAVEDVTADQPEPAFKIERRMDLPPKHRLGEARRMAVHRRDNRVRRLLPLLVPTPARPEIVAEVLA